MKTVIKIICSVLLAAGIIVGAIPVCAAADYVYIRGDANGDGVITIKDVTTVQRVVAQLQEDPKGEITRRARVTSKYNLSISDATAIQSYLAEFENVYKIGNEVHYDPYELPFIPK